MIGRRMPEYWLIDPQAHTVTVLVLSGQADDYWEHVEFTVGQTADSAALPGFALGVRALVVILGITDSIRPYETHASIWNHTAV